MPLQAVDQTVIMKRARRRRAELAITPAARDMTGEATNLLMIDTSTEQPAVGLIAAADHVHLSSSLATARHGSDLVPRIGELFRGPG